MLLSPQAKSLHKKGIIPPLLIYFYFICVFIKLSFSKNLSVMLDCTRQINVSYTYLLLKGTLDFEGQNFGSQKKHQGDT